MPDTPSELFDLICETWETHVIPRAELSPLTFREISTFYDSYYYHVLHWQRRQGRIPLSVTERYQIVRLVVGFEYPELHKVATSLKKIKQDIHDTVDSMGSENPALYNEFFASFIVDFIMGIALLD